MLAQDAPFLGVALLPRHGAHIEQVRWLLVRRLLQLAAVHQLDVGNRYGSGLPRVLVLESAAQSG